MNDEREYIAERDPKTGRIIKQGKLAKVIGKENQYVPEKIHYGAARANHFRNLVKKATTDKDMKEVWGVLMEKAKGGSLEAIELLLRYTIGLPKDATNQELASLQGGIKIVMQQIDVTLPTESTPMPTQILDVTPMNESTPTTDNNASNG